MADVTGGAVTDVGGASMTREREREQQQYAREREREQQQYDVTGGSVTDVAAPAAPEQGLDAPGLDLSSLVLSLSSTFVLEKELKASTFVLDLLYITRALIWRRCV